jgi:RHS repeat-associated protein
MRTSHFMDASSTVSYRNLRRVLHQVVLGLLAIAAFGLAATSAFAQSTADIFYIYADHLNTPRVITNNVGQPVWRWDNVDPFGANAPNENPGGLGTFTCNLRFPGQYFDRETGLHYNYFRDYDPSIGRYIQSDRIGLGGGLNTYAYVAGNPLSYADPTGTAVQPASSQRPNVITPRPINPNEGRLNPFVDQTPYSPSSSSPTNICLMETCQLQYEFGSPLNAQKVCVYQCYVSGTKTLQIHALLPCPRTISPGGRFP